VAQNGSNGVRLLSLIRRRPSPGPSRPLRPPDPTYEVVERNPSFVTGPTGDCIYASRQVLALLDVTPEAFLGTGWHALLHHHWTPEHAQDWADPNCVGRSFTNIRPGPLCGNRRYFHTTARTLFGADGRVEGHVCQVRDLAVLAAPNVETDEEQTA